MERSRTRVQKVLAVYDGAATSEYLRQTVSPLQLLAHAQSMCGQLDSQVEPLLVRLARRSPRKTVSSDFAISLDSLAGSIRMKMCRLRLHCC